MQELTNSIKISNPRIMGIEEEMQAKAIHNIFNKIVTENFPLSTENYAHSGTGTFVSKSQQISQQKP
jgi:hypothetical protein